jgi:hypothetical protein
LDQLNDPSYIEQGVEIDIISSIGALFGSLDTIPYEYTRLHQRRIILGLMTIQHIIPLWKQAHPSDTSFQQQVYNFTAIVMNRKSNVESQLLMEQFWEWEQGQTTQPSTENSIIWSIYTLSHIVEAICGEYIRDDYTPDTHANVSLGCCLRAFTDYHKQHTLSSIHHSRRFIRYWLTSIVPRTWFDINGNDIIYSKHAMP